ncbi:ATP-NAD kinase-like domain-containing protein [Aspergillus keveii]|uniref:ATP-NAD kinase-like domain-containing protein n=1 Tax=Aspergillus keveii TaxID=714993 RepID=A0ABR4GAY2_9EURO
MAFNSSPCTEQSDSHLRLLGHDSTLMVGQSVSLTLGGDSLLVVDERAMRKSDRTCCGLLPKPTNKVTHSISLYNVLDTKVSPAGLTITYAEPAGKNDVSVTALQYSIADEEKATVETWSKKLLSLAYGNAQRYKRLKVLINPFGGKGTAAKLYRTYAEPVFDAAQCQLDVQETTHGGHATEIAEQLDIDAYDAIVCCSGDGLPYEVFNGLAKKPNAREALSKLAVAMLPCGSGNAMAWNLCGTGSVSVAALTIVKGLRMPMDLMSVTQGSSRTLSFLSQSFGIIADSDLGTDNIRWMGAHRFTYGFLMRLMHKAIYPCDLAIKVAIDDKTAIKNHFNTYVNSNTPVRPTDAGGEESKSLPELEYGTVLDPLPEDWTVIPGETIGNFFAGNMAIVSKDTNFFPASVPNDGLMDIVTVDGTTSRAKILKMMTAVPEGAFFDMPEVDIRKALAFRLTPREKEGFISVDGEKIPFEAFQVEIHKGLGTVLSKSGHLYEAQGPRP